MFGGRRTEEMHPYLNRRNGNSVCAGWGGGQHCMKRGFFYFRDKAIDLVLCRMFKDTQGLSVLCHRSKRWRSFSLWTRELRFGGPLHFCRHLKTSMDFLHIQGPADRWCYLCPLHWDRRHQQRETKLYYIPPTWQRVPGKLYDSLIKKVDGIRRTTIKMMQTGRSQTITKVLH